MNKSLIAAAFACTALAIPTLALADDAMSGRGAMSSEATAKMATMICRTAGPTEKPTATLTGSNTALVCKTIKPEMMMKKGTGPDLSRALSSDQVDDAWRQFIQGVVTIPLAGGGG
jgi:hypothetical protein